MTSPPTISVGYTGYGFWHTWNLLLCDKKGELHSYYLGQDVKLVQRVLGMDMTYFKNLVGGELGVTNPALNMSNPKVLQAIAAVIIQELGGAKKILKSNPWDLTAD